MFSTKDSKKCVKTKTQIIISDTILREDLITIVMTNTTNVFVDKDRKYQELFLNVSVISFFISV